MRTYIFTDRERRIIQRFLSGNCRRDDPILMTVLSRSRSFKNLNIDVDLFMRLRETEATTAT
jgi:hypothetical protein